MTQSVTIYHNPRCSKSRETLKLIQSKGIEPEIIRYLETPPDTVTLAKLISQLGMTPRALLRKNEAEYKEAGLNDPDKTDAEVIKAMQQHPRLIERPIVVAGNRAILGRPPENVLELLD